MSNNRLLREIPGTTRDRSCSMSGDFREALGFHLTVTSLLKRFIKKQKLIKRQRTLFKII